MGSIKVRRRLAHRWADLFGLVADIERFPEFVPCCQRTHVLRREVDPAGNTVIVSRMTVGVSALTVSYVNRTVVDLQGRRISVSAADGPLRRLDVLWTFSPKTETTTEVGFSVSYEFNGIMLELLAASMFDAMFRQIVGAFERRADQLSCRGVRAGQTTAPAMAAADLTR